MVLQECYVSRRQRFLRIIDVSMLAKSNAGSMPKIKETGIEYCGIDLHAEYCQICILDEGGEVMETSRVRTSRNALARFFDGIGCEW